MAVLNAYTFQSMTVSPIIQRLPQSLVMASDGQAGSVFITCEGECRYTYHDGDGLSPTDGHLLRDGSFITLKGQLQIGNFKVIATGTQPARLAISYERI